MTLVISPFIAFHVFFTGTQAAGTAQAIKTAPQPASVCTACINRNKKARVIASQTQQLTAITSIISPILYKVKGENFRKTYCNSHMYRV